MDSGFIKGWLTIIGAVGMILVGIGTIALPLGQAAMDPSHADLGKIQEALAAGGALITAGLAALGIGRKLAVIEKK